MCSSHSLNTVNILLVDDNLETTGFIEEIASTGDSTQFLLTAVNRLSEAVTYLSTHTADVVLLGLKLPDGQGAALIHPIIQAAPEIPVIVIMDRQDKTPPGDLKNAGALDCLYRDSITPDLITRSILFSIERCRNLESQKQNNQLQHLVLNSLSAHIAILDADGTISAVNRAWAEFAAANKAAQSDSYVGTNYLHICGKATDDDYAVKSAAGIKSVVEGSQDFFTMEYPCHSPDQQRWFKVRVTPLPGPVPRRVVVAHENITKKFLAEESSRANEEQLRLVIDSSVNCVFIQDADGRYVLVNSTLADLYSKTKAEMIGKTDAELINNGLPGAGGKGTKIKDSLSDKKEKTFSHTGPFKLGDGQKRWFNTVLTPITLPDGQDCTLGIASDITEYRHAQDTIRNSELRLRTILDAQTSRMLLLDPQLKILWPNRAACREAGQPLEQMIGKSCHEIWCQEADTCRQCPVVKALDDGKAHTIKKNTTDGRTWRVHGIPVRDNKGRIVSVVEITEDISERMVLEDQLRQAQKMESLGTLAGGIAHDFNNILAGILGFTELALEKTTAPATQRGYMQEAYNAGLRATDLVGQILTFSRRTDTELRPLNISIIVKEALKLLRSTLPTTIDIQHHIEHGLEPVLADPTQIHQIIMNLCTNASHAMEPYGGTLKIELSRVNLSPEEVEVRDSLLPGKHIKVTVSDTGCGISPEIIPSVFDPYFTTKDLGEGTGLGLSVVHGIVKEYGGDISVDSILGKGTTFTLFLPAVTKVARDSKKLEEELLPRGTERILVVDDEPAILKICSRILARQGYVVTAERDSEKALAKFRDTPKAFDLVLSDVTMPKLSGDRLAAEIMAIRPDIPVLLCTGYTKLISKQDAKDMGIRALITKPVVKKLLMTEIRKALDDRSR